MKQMSESVSQLATEKYIWGTFMLSLSEAHLLQAWWGATHHAACCEIPVKEDSHT